jgi:hypothetical protein
MKHNVIILTSGLSGSSVLTGLIARAGYWTGDSTHKKRDYDTFENSELIELNRRLFDQAGYTGNYLVEFSSRAMKDIAELAGKVTDPAFTTFIAKCNRHHPWIWKDPRLWLTIRFWKPYLDLNNCKFVLLTRSIMQSWVSQILRRQIVSYAYSKNYEASIQRSITEFLEENNLSFTQVGYENLIVHPVETIRKLNEFLETELTIDDLRQVYHRPLYKNPRTSWANHVKALAIYAKNYSERIDFSQATPAIREHSRAAGEH